MNSSPKRRDDYLETQRGKEHIAVTLILDVKTRWNSTLAMLERAYRLKSYTYCWLNGYPQYQSLFTTEDEWKAVEYVLQVLLPFRYWTLWMSKRRTITLHRVISIYNDMFDHMDSVLKALSKKRVQWKRDIHRAVRCARAKLRKYYSRVTPETGLILISAAILDPFRKLRIFESWDKEMGMISDDPDSYTSQYSHAFLEYWEKNYVDVEGGSLGGDGNKEKEKESEIDNGNGEKVLPQIYGLESSDEEDNIQMTESTYSTPRTASRKSLLMQQARQYLANARVNIESEQHDYPIGDELMSDDPEEVTASFWYPDVAGWWMKQERRMGDYRDLARMARDIFSVMPHGVGVEASFSLGRDVISWRQSRTKAATLQQKVVVRQWARSNDGFLPDEVKKSLEGDNDEDERQKKEDERLNQLASMRDFLMFKKESQNRRSMQKKLKGKDVAVSGLGYISDEDDGWDEKWSSFDHDGNTAFRKVIRDKRLVGRNIESGSVTRVCYGNLVGKIKRVSWGHGVDRVSATDTDTALSESEAVWMLSDSEVEESEMEAGDASGESLREGELNEEDDLEMKESTPDHGLLIPGFNNVVRRSTRLEVRKQVGGESQVRDKINNVQQVEAGRLRRKRF